jgi:hypothetical protein
VKKEQNGRESLRRLNPVVGCNASRRRRFELFAFSARIFFYFKVCGDDLMVVAKFLDIIHHLRLKKIHYIS